jgi:phosphate transport system substrate-binding protein
MNRRKWKLQINVLLILVFFSIPLFSDISYEGSSTIGEGFMPEAASIFFEQTGIKFSSIGLLGSGKGYAAVKEGSVDLGGLSRPLKTDEKNSNMYYQIIGYDAIVIFVNSSNPVKSLSRDQVKSIFSGKIRNWREVGGNNDQIQVVTEIIEGKRATIEEFKQLAMDGAAYGPVKEIDKPRDCVEYVSKTKNAVTFASISFKMQGLKMLNYAGSEPTLDNVSSGAYPLSRPLILVSRGYPAGELKKFYQFILSEKGQATVGEKFIPVRK